jgi:hypothetical protein
MVPDTSHQFIKDYFTVLKDVKYFRRFVQNTI